MPLRNYHVVPHREQGRVLTGQETVSLATPVVQQGSQGSQHTAHSVRNGTAKMAQWRKALALQAW